MRIRRFKPEDAAAISQIYHLAVHKVARRDYSEAQVEVWSPAPIPTDRMLARLSDIWSVWVAVTEQDTPVAFIELQEDGYIDCFYCHPDHAGNGVGSALYAQLEEAAKRADLRHLYVDASEPARRFFLRQGFGIAARLDFERGGVPIHNYRMEKRLDLGT